MSIYCIAIEKRKCAAICVASPPLNPPTRLRHFPRQVWAQQQPLGQLAVFYFHVIARRAAGLKDALLGYAKWRRWAFDRIPFSTFDSHTFFSFFFFYRRCHTPIQRAAISMPNCHLLLTQHATSCCALPLKPCEFVFLPLQGKKARTKITVMKCHLCGMKKLTINQHTFTQTRISA